MLFKYDDSHAFKKELSEVKDNLREVKKDPTKVLSYDEKTRINNMEATYLDVFTINHDKGVHHNYTLESLIEAFPPLGNRPFWYMGTRCTRKQFKGLMAVIG